jgi:sterol desaturase/sphingolipid hydroxylase (fatty acid hydroxylase superfamily)
MSELLTRQPWILGILLALAIFEWIWRTQIARKGYDLRASMGSLGVAAIGALLKPLNAAVIAGTFVAVAAITPIDLPVDDWRVWVACFFSVEFAYYWFHRWSHTVNLLWASHAVHHSANEMTLPAAIRLGWTNALSGGWLVFVPLILIGFPPVMVGGLLAANLLYQYSLHTEAVGKLWQPVEFIVNTPSHHRAHHASNDAWLDCNFGGVLIVFDRMFGTFVAEPDNGGLSYGLTQPLKSNNPFRIALRQWGVLLSALGRATSLREGAKTLFGRPGILDIGAR